MKLPPQNNGLSERRSPDRLATAIPSRFADPGIGAPDAAPARRISNRSHAGILLIECLTYMAVFAVLTSIGLAAFYLCWNDSKALVYATDDISAALRTGERWRADVRSATGKISVETNSAGELVRIPHGKDEVFYSYHSGALRRKLASVPAPELLFAKANTSQMSAEVRDGVTTWRWELELPLRRPETQLLLLFTFKAAQTKP